MINFRKSNVRKKKQSFYNANRHAIKKQNHIQLNRIMFYPVSFIIILLVILFSTLLISLDMNRKTIIPANKYHQHIMYIDIEIHKNTHSITKFPNIPIQQN